MPELWVVNSEQTKSAFHDRVDKLWAEHKYLTFPAPRIGPDRSISQNDLFHVWLREYAAFLTPCHTKEVTKGMMQGIKRSVKGMYYRETNADFMVHQVWCPLTKREKTDFTSSASWKRGEMFDVLNWLQVLAANSGCILESKGEHAKLVREQNE